MPIMMVTPPSIQLLQAYTKSLGVNHDNRLETVTFPARFISFGTQQGGRTFTIHLTQANCSLKAHYVTLFLRKMDMWLDNNY